MKAVSFIAALLFCLSICAIHKIIDLRQESEVVRVKTEKKFKVITKDVRHLRKYFIIALKQDSIMKQCNKCKKLTIIKND